MGKFNCSGILTGSTSRASTVEANVLDEPPVQFYAAQPLFFLAPCFSDRTSRRTKASVPWLRIWFDTLHIPSSRNNTPSLATGTAAGLRNPPQVGELALSTFGDPEQTIVPGVPDTTCVFVSPPSLHNREEQSFEEAWLRRYEFYDGESEPLVTPKWPETTFGHCKAPAPYTVVRSLFIASRSGLLSAE